MTGSRHWATRVATITCTVALVVALSGCALMPHGPESPAALRMQSSVSAVTQAAAAGDPAGAIAALDALEAQLKQDTASGAISADRSARIQASIDLVRADLTAALPTPSPTPTDKHGNKGGDKGDGGGGKDK